MPKTHKKYGIRHRPNTRRKYRKKTNNVRKNKSRKITRKRQRRQYGRGIGYRGSLKNRAWGDTKAAKEIAAMKITKRRTEAATEAATKAATEAATKAAAKAATRRLENAPKAATPRGGPDDDGSWRGYNNLHPDYASFYDEHYYDGE
jgi:hypothetical protein